MLHFQPATADLDFLAPDIGLSRHSYGPSLANRSAAVPERFGAGARCGTSTLVLGNYAGNYL